MVKKMDKGGKWTFQGGQGPTCHAGQPHHGSTHCAMWPSHITDPWERLPKPSHTLILSQFAPMDEMEWLWIHRPTVIHLGASNRPTNRLFA